MNPGEEERIRRRAYEIWEREGRPEGRDAEHWRQAAAEIAAADRESAAAPKPAPTPAPEAPPPRRSRPVPRRDGGTGATARRKPEAP